MAPTTADAETSVQTEAMVPHVANRESGYPPSLQVLLDGIKAQMGFVADSVAVYLHRPAIAEATLRFTAAVGKDPSSTLDRLLKRKIGLVCSTINGCFYCTAHQCSYLAKPREEDAESWGLSRADLESLVDGSYVPADEFERVCLDFSRAASRNSSAIPDEVRARMKALLTPAQIVELAFVVGHWKLYNTVNDSLALPIEAVNREHTGYVEIAQASMN